MLYVKLIYLKSSQTGKSFFLYEFICIKCIFEKIDNEQFSKSTLLRL